MNSTVLITVDCLRADHVGCYGYERPTTPRLDERAEKYTKYGQSFSNAPGTRWALQTLLTGLWSFQIDGSGLPRKGKGPAILPELFKKKGYKTGAFVNNGYLSRDYGYDRGFDEFQGVEDFPENPDSSGKQDPQQYRADWTDRELVDRTLEWIIERQEKDQPFFAWVHLMDAHTPYSRWDKHVEALTGTTNAEHVIEPQIYCDLEVGETPPQFVIDTYDACVRRVDEQLDRLLSDLAGETNVAITGDHGEDFWEFNGFHTHSLYSCMAQVPILVKLPGIEAGAVDEFPAQHMDLPASLARAANLEIPQNWESTPLQEAERGYDYPVYLEVGEEQIGVRAGDWKLIRDETGDYSLYQAAYGEKETKDLKQDQEKRYHELKEKLREHKKYVSNNQIELLDTELSEETKESLENLGYL